MKRVTGLGGIFFKVANPVQTSDWYREHLGLEAQPDGTTIFEWREKNEPDKPGATI